MRNSLKHLPEKKQQELRDIVKIIYDLFSIEMLILFGSYARGDWVEEYADDGLHFQYQSDLDLLIIIENDSTSKQLRLEHEIRESIDRSGLVNTPISIIVHDIKFVNRKLDRAQYFFSDIKKEGILLYDSGKFKLNIPKELTSKERYRLAQNDFEYWFTSSQDFLKIFSFCYSEKQFANAAFILHQAAERLYSGILLVFTRYKPNTHKLAELRNLVNTLDSRFIKIFPLTSREDIKLFSLLCNAYIDARYKKNYIITSEELEEIYEKVKQLSQITDLLCREKIEHFLLQSVS